MLQLFLGLGTDMKEQIARHNFDKTIIICRLGLAKRDLRGLGAESWFVVAIGGSFWQKNSLLQSSDLILLYMIQAS